MQQMDLAGLQRRTATIIAWACGRFRSISQRAIEEAAANVTASEQYLARLRHEAEQNVPGGMVFAATETELKEHRRERARLEDHHGTDSGLQATYNELERLVVHFTVRNVEYEQEMANCASFLGRNERTDHAIRSSREYDTLRRKPVK
ncbi:unnamed protein product [Cercospora beticola]|nr:unnamed protein product [Cercospora beticola]